MKQDLRQFFDEYINECEFSRKLRPETLRGYRQTFSTFLKLMPDISLNNLFASNITHFFKILHERKRVAGKNQIKTGVKKSTIATYWSKLNNYFEWLRIKKIIPANPFKEMEYPSPTYDDKKFLKKENVEKIIAAIHTHCSCSLLILKRNLVIFYILLFCGLRREELLFLQIRDIDLERKILTVRAETSKIPRTRYLPLHSQVVFYLKDYLKERKRFQSQYLIISSSRDDRLSYAALKHLVTKLKYHSGIQFHLHQFRHTFAINFLKSSNNIAKLKQLMGHKDIRMTMVYLRCLPTEEMKGDIERMSLDNLI